MKKLLTRFENLWESVGKYLVATLILSIPLYPKFPFIDVPGIYVSIRLEDFVIFIVCVLWFLGNLRKLPTLRTNKIWRAFILFWVIGLVATLSGIFLNQTVLPVVGILNWGRRIEYMIVFLVCLDLKVTKKQLKFFILCFAVVVIYAFIDGVGQKYLNWPIITTQNSEYSKGIALRFMPGGHIVSTFAGHYDLASFLILITPLFVVFACYAKVFLDKKSKLIFQSLLVLVSILGLWLIANAASRISIVSYVGSISLALLLVRRAYLIPVVFVVVFLVAGTSSSLMARYMNIFDVLVKKVHAAEIVVATPEPTIIPVVAPELEDRSTNIRLAVEWPRALRALTKNPFLGTGYSSITLATDNEYLRSLGEVGVLGSLAFVLCFVLVFAELFKGFFRKKEYSTQKLLAASAIAMIPGVFLNMVFIDILEASKFAIMFWLFLGITISHLRNNYEN